MADCSSSKRALLTRSASARDRGRSGVPATSLATGSSVEASKRRTSSDLPNDDDTARPNKKRDDHATPNNANTRAARAALDAIKIPDEIRQTIAERIRPGASLIISDREQSGETGDGTEFVVLTR